MQWFQKKPEMAADAALTEYTDSSQNFKEQGARLSCQAHIQNAMNAGQRGAVLKLYLENFKQLNEVFGYDYCEQLLDNIIQYLQARVRRPVYRYIGVEFIIILEHYTQGQAESLAETLLEQFDHVWKVENTDCLCSAQIGICSYPGHAADAGELLKCLDAAISRASELGPNQVICYDSVLHASVSRKRAIAKYLQTALDHQEIEVRYRPVYNLTCGRFTRAEFSMRVFIQGLGMAGSGEFLPAAEDSGQIRAVEYFALDQVGRCIADLLAQGTEFESISLPISSVLFLQEDFSAAVWNVIQTYRIPAGKLALEVEETALTTAYLTINTTMQELSEMGVELILNNFGTGYSSITNILDLPVHTLKMDRSFICQMETNPKSLPIIEGLLGIARSLELPVIAEGVETTLQVDALTSYQCPYQQGFYYAPTVTHNTLLQVIGSSLEQVHKMNLSE